MAQISEIVTAQRQYFASGRTLPLQFRTEALKALKETLHTHEEEIAAALQKDLGKSAFEAYATETGLVLDEIDFTLKHLKGWMRPRRAHTPLVHFPSSCRILRDPYGVALIMSPWNYPLQLTLAPLVGAIAGGNCAVVKPSAYSPATSAVLADIIGEAFDPRHVAVVEGGREENKTLLEETFDTIFFTGSVAVGKFVMESASRHLTPVTLELGGKSPCIVCEDADIDLAARRIIWGKLLNAGQTCVAPDYVLVHEDVQEKLIAAMKKYITRFYGKDPLQSRDYPHIVNRKHFDRLSGYLACGRVVAGGQTDPERLKIAPTILTGTGWDTPVMLEEIFGPILPVLPFKNVGEAAARISSRPKPLALYLFTNSRVVRESVLQSVPFGGGCVNDTIVHLATSSMPFGGVGSSGMGGYHGKWSFDTFTHQKSVLQKSNRLDIPLRYPPYRGKLGLLKRLMG